MSYDPSNVFAKILRGEIPAKKIFENDYALAFPDINATAPTHVLVIPKGDYEQVDDFMSRASDAEIVGFFKAVRSVAQQLGVGQYRLISNNGEAAGQSVPHFHVHLLAGKPLGPLLAE